MPKPSSHRALAAMQGFEPGSVFSFMSLAEQKAFRRWLQERRTDARVMESQLGHKPFQRPRSLQEV